MNGLRNFRLGFIVLGAAGLWLTGCVHMPVPPPVPPPSPQPSPVPRPLPPVAQPLPPPPAESSVPVDIVFAIQVRLDREHFSTGGIDGRWGSKSEKALAAWQKKNGKPATGQVDDAVVAALGDTNGVMTTCVVAAADHAALTP